MKIAIAKELFHQGVIKDLKLVKTGEKKWHLEIHKIDGISLNTLLNDKGETRIFKSLEAAYNVAKDIGVCKITIDIPSNIKHDFDL